MNNLSEEMALTSGDERKRYVRNMFNAIAHRYDLLNHLLSAGVDIIWRKKAIKKLDVSSADSVLDLACGTGDFAFETYSEKKCRVYGLDIAGEMLRIAQKKAEAKKGKNKLAFLNGDGEYLPFKNSSFKGVTIAFGIRNMGSIEDALAEMYRILKEEGQAIILEFSLPSFKPFAALYVFYFNNILPLIGKMISRDNSAYSYLPASVEKFPSVEKFSATMISAGFSGVESFRLLNGIAVIYKGIK